MNYRRSKRILLLVIFLTLSRGLPLRAADAPDPTHAEIDPHPVLPTNDHWASVLLCVILLGFFIPAAIVGPLARYLAADELPELHTSEETDSHSATQHEPGHTGHG